MLPEHTQVEVAFDRIRDRDVSNVSTRYFSDNTTGNGRGIYGSTMSPTSGEGSQWYALWTRSRHEKRVREQLQRKSVEVFLPTFSKWSRWKDRKKQVEWPLFPGYCFARFDAADRLPVLTCDGVVQIVGIEGVPSPIPAHEVEGIRQLVDSELAYDPCPLVKEGEMVKLVSGPLKGVVGRLVRKGAHARLMLSVDLIGQAVSVEVDAADVRPY